MDLPDLKQLDKVIALCRKRGVKSIKIDNVEITLSDTAPAAYKRPLHAQKQAATTSIPLPEGIEQEQLTEEQLLFYSVQDVIGPLKGETQ